MELGQAQVIAKKWIETLKPFCDRIEIAGSIRRNKYEIKDIDLVAIPKTTDIPGLLQGFTTTFNALEDAIPRLFMDHKYLATLKSGPKYKQLLLNEGIHLELWIVTPPASWGVIYLQRTGPEDFGHWAVTQKNKGGALPSYLHVEGGAIWHRSRKLETPEEKDVFEILGMDYIEPDQRRAQWRVLEHG
jgi:DNA polymerase/3'-5' exonuclease PolX